MKSYFTKLRLFVTSFKTRLTPLSTHKNLLKCTAAIAILCGVLLIDGISSIHHSEVLSACFYSARIVLRVGASLFVRHFEHHTNLNQLTFSDPRAELPRLLPGPLTLYNLRPERKRPALGWLGGMNGTPASL